MIFTRNQPEMPETSKITSNAMGMRDAATTHDAKSPKYNCIIVAECSSHNFENRVIGNFGEGGTSVVTS